MAPGRAVWASQRSKGRSPPSLVGPYDRHRAEAAAAYREALALAATDAERRYLTRRLAEVTAA
jgi:hypothetical protein